jgi:hypothetical protein
MAEQGYQCHWKRTRQAGRFNDLAHHEMMTPDPEGHWQAVNAEFGKRYLSPTVGVL